MVSPLGKVKGLGASGHGSGQWWLQRLTALALIPLSVWFMASLMMVAQSPDPFRVADWLSAPSHAVLAALLLVAIFWHAKLGLQVVIEDYIHCPWGKFALLIGNAFFCFGAAATGLLAILKLHLLDIVSGF